MNPESNQKRIAFGYDRFNGRIVINEGQAAVVKLIYTWYAEGMSLGEIKKTLEDMSIPSPQNKPIWSKQALSNILSNEHYLGSDIYPVLVDDELFVAVQSIKNTKASQFSGQSKADAGV